MTEQIAEYDQGIEQSNRLKAGCSQNRLPYP
jgi:hypothetical protein